MVEFNPYDIHIVTKKIQVKMYGLWWKTLHTYTFREVPMMDKFNQEMEDNRTRYEFEIRQYEKASDEIWGILMGTGDAEVEELTDEVLAAYELYLKKAKFTSEPIPLTIEEWSKRRRTPDYSIITHTPIRLRNYGVTTVYTQSRYTKDYTVEDEFKAKYGWV